MGQVTVEGIGHAGIEKKICQLLEEQWRWQGLGKEVEGNQDKESPEMLSNPALIVFSAVWQGQGLEIDPM